MVTVRLERAVSSNASGSETIWAPTGITTEDRPANVTARELPGSMALTPTCPPAGSATETLVIGSSAPPKALEKRSRSFGPPTETRTVCRTVLSVKTAAGPVKGAGGRLAGSVSCGIDTHVFTHRGPGPASDVPVATDPAADPGLASTRVPLRCGAVRA